MTRHPTPPESPLSGSPPASRARIWTVVLLYAAFAGLWILLSDKAVEWLLDDPGQITLVSTLKGWAFVAVTSLLLYGLMRRLLHPSAPEPAPVFSRGYRILSLGLLALAILGLTAGGIAYSVLRQKDQEVARLQAIADLKTRQIADWMKERYGDARFVRTSRFWTDLYHRWKDAGDAASGRYLLERLEDFRRHKALQSIHLLDEDDGALWDSAGVRHTVHPELAAAVRNPTTPGADVLHLGPYRDTDGRLHLDFLSRLPRIDGHPGPVVVLHTDPAHHLFPILQTWPVPSASGETLLFRRNGDQVLFLNELRHQEGTACRLNLPVATAGLLAAQVLRDPTRLGRLLEGVDYREVPALGVARAIPGTDWLLVAKIDRQELFAAASRDAVWIGLAGLLALFMAGTGAVLLRQHQELGVSLRERELQAERLRALELLDAIAEGSSDAIFAKDREGRYLLFNRAAARVTGKAPHEVLGRDDTAVFPPEQAALVMANDRQVMEQDRSVTFQEELTTPEGDVTFLATKGPLHDAEGRVIGIFGISRDITERRRSEAALQESEARQRLFIEHAPVALAMFDREMRYLSCSRRWRSDYRLGEREIIGRSHYEVFPEIGEDWKAVHRRALAGSVERAESDRFERADGSVQWLRWEVRPWQDQTGGIAGLLIFSEDITARRLAEEALERSEERFRRAMDATSDGLWDWDVASGAIYFSPGYFRMLGYEPGAIPADPETFLTLVHPEDRERVQAANEACIANTRPAFDVEFRMRGQDGRWRWVLGRGRAVRRAETGQALQIVGTYVDITERKQAETERARVEAQLRQSQKMEALGTLAGGIAHDFNNILGIIIGFTELAAAGAGPDSPVQEDLTEVLQASRRARDLVQQILAFSRLDEPAKKPVQVGTIVKETLKMLRASLPATIEIRQEVAARGVVLGDPTQLHQVLLNLCTNAAHAMQEEGGRLEVRLEDHHLAPEAVPPHSGLAPGPYMRLTVTDTGHGIPPEIQERIFDPFFTTKEQGVGTGLGLSVVHGIVQRHGGAIELQSTPGQGTTFTVLLPELERTVEPLGAAAETLPRGSENVLVVDDEPTLTRVIRQLLERLGYTVACCGSGAEALETFRRRLEHQPFDLVITDMTMPRMTGMALARELLALRPGLPILIATGFSEKLNPTEAARLGIRGILMKPFNAKELARVVRRALEEGGESDALRRPRQVR